MIDPFMANLGTSGIAMFINEGTVPAGNGKTVEPAEADFQTILETICGAAETKPVSEQDETTEIKAVNSRFTGELQSVPGLNPLTKQALSGDRAADELLLSESEFEEGDNRQRQTPGNNEVIPVILPEMPAATALVSVATFTGTEAASEVVQTENTDAKAQNAESKIMPQLFEQTRSTANHPILFGQAEVLTTGSRMVPGVQEQLPVSAGNRQPEKEPAGLQAPHEVNGPSKVDNGDSFVQSRYCPEQVTDNSESMQHPVLENTTKMQPVKPEVIPESETELSRPAKSIPERAIVIDSTVKEPSDLKSPENFGGTAVKAAPTYPDDWTGVVTGHPKKVVGDKPVRQSRLPEDNLMEQGEPTFSLPVRELPRQTVAGTGVAKGGEQKAVMNSSQTVVMSSNQTIVTTSDYMADFSQVLRVTESTQAVGLNPQPSKASVTTTVPTEMPDTAGNIVSDLNLTLAQSVLRQNPLHNGRGGKPPVLRNVNTAFHGIAPQTVKTTLTLTGNNLNPGQGEIVGLELTQALEDGIDRGAVTAGRSQFGTDNGTGSIVFRDDSAPVQLSVADDSVTATVQPGSYRKEVLSSVIPSQTDKSPVEAEIAFGQKNIELEGAGTSQSPEVTNALPLPVVEKSVQNTHEVIIKTEPVVNKQEVFSQLIEQAKLMVNQGQSEMELSLKPEHLGKLKLRIALDHQVVTAQFTVESEQVKQIIETNLVQLRKLLQDTGVQVENLSITVGQQDAGTDFSQHSNSGAHHSRAYRGATITTNEGLDYTPEVTKPVHTKSLIDLIA